MDKDKQSSRPSKQQNYNPSDSTTTSATNRSSTNSTNNSNNMNKQSYGTSKTNSNPATQTKSSYDSTKDCK